MTDLFEAAALKAQRDDFFKAIHAGEELDCPCCGRYARLYRRKIYSTMVRGLIQIYRKRNNFEGVHRMDAEILAAFPDFTKFRYWQIIQKVGNDDPDKKDSGAYIITEKGFAWLKGKITVPKYVTLFDDEVLGFSEDHIDVRAALGEKFSYEALMQGEE